jgi:DNA-binding response OmpR family regulator
MMQPTNPQLILIVDDNLTNLEVMSKTLSDAGYEVAIALSGERAIRQIQNGPPDLILLDIMMAGIDGYETCQLIKKNSEWASIPIIFMTALADTSNKVKGFELGAVDYITKPFQEQELLARVKTHLRLKQTEMHLRESEARIERILNSLEEVVWSATLDLSQFIFLNPAVKKNFWLFRQ